MAPGKSRTFFSQDSDTFSRGFINLLLINSFNPRLRHAYLEWDRLLIGQTWSTFMVVVVPDEIDFSGALDGLVFIRQPQIRYKAGSWWFALENPETTITSYQGSAPEVTDSEILPDIIIRKNFSGD